MQFDKAFYIENRTKIIELIKSTHHWDTTEGFIADGIVDLEIYEMQKLKILVILAESYGYDKNEVTDIELQPLDDILGLGHPNRQTPKKIATLLWLLYKSIDEGRPLIRSELPKLFISNDDNYKSLQFAISRTAYINVKKASKPIPTFGNGTTRLDYYEVYSHAMKNIDVLKMQIESISPDLMIVCSDPVYNSLYDSKLLGKGIELGKKYIVQINEYGQNIIHVSHPNYLEDWGYDGIYDIYQRIYNAFFSKYMRF